MFFWDSIASRYAPGQLARNNMCGIRSAIFYDNRPVFSESAPILLVRRYMIRIHLAVIIGFHVQGISETG